MTASEVRRLAERTAAEVQAAEHEELADLRERTRRAVAAWHYWTTCPSYDTTVAYNGFRDAMQALEGIG